MSKINVNNIEANDASTDITVTTGGSQSLLVDTNGKLTVAGNLSVNGNNYPSAGPLSNRNLIINGAMQVAQRGTSGGATAGYVYTLDRWLANGNITSWSQTGSQKDVLQVVTQAGTGIAQRVESNGAKFVSGKTYTLSFQINPSIADVEIGITFRNGNSYLSDVVGVTDVSSQVTAGSYSTVTHTFTLSSSADIATYASHNMQVYIGSSVVNTLNITGVQLEVGDTATPFEHRSYGDELARCQRYYQQEQEGGFARLGVVPTATANREAPYKLRVEMRTAPTVTASGGNYYVFSSASIDAVTSTTISAITKYGFFQISSGSVSRTAGDIVALNSWLITADAEL